LDLLLLARNSWNFSIIDLPGELGIWSVFGGTAPDWHLFTTWLPLACAGDPNDDRDPEQFFVPPEEE